MSSKILADRYDIRGKTELNGPGEAHARSLIKAGKVNSGAWSFDAADGDKWLDKDGNVTSEYGSWFLGVDPSAPADTKAHFKYPFGKDGEVYLAALRAIRSRSAQQRATGVFNAAGKLLDLAQPKEASKDREYLPPGLERRSFPGDIRIETRASGSPVIRGYAAVYNSLSDDLGGFRERVLPGCFRGCLDRGTDVRAFFNHDTSAILARRSAGNLRLFDDDNGLGYEIDPPDTSTAIDLLENIRCGNIRESSFGFTCTRQEWGREGEWMTRDLVEADIFDVSPVTYPAYPDATVALRSLEAARGRLPRSRSDRYLTSYLDWLRAIDAAS